MSLAHTNGQHHEHQLRIALVPQSTSQHHEHQLRVALAPQATSQHQEHQLGNMRVWHMGTASITSISCELLRLRNQQVSASCISLEICVWHRNSQHHEHQLRIASALQSTGHHHEHQLRGLGTHARPASRASAANCVGPAIQTCCITSISLDIVRSGTHARRIALAPQSTSQHHEHQLRIALRKQGSLRHTNGRVTSVLIGPAKQQGSFTKISL